MVASSLLIISFRVELWKEENETPGWTQLKLPGQSPSPRCGHTVTSGGHYVSHFTSGVFILCIGFMWYHPFLILGITVYFCSSNVVCFLLCNLIKN